MVKWEYMYVSVPDSDTVNELVLLDQAGEEGWEATGYVKDTGFSTEFFMKRRVPITIRSRESTPEGGILLCLDDSSKPERPPEIKAEGVVGDY